MEDIEKTVDQLVKGYRNINQFPVCLGAGIDAFDMARRLETNERQAIISILEDISDLIGHEYGDKDKEQEAWTRLKYNLEKLKASKAHENISRIFHDLEFVTPDPMEKDRKIHP